MLWAGRAGIRGELRQTRKRQVDLAACALYAEVADRGDEAGVEIARFQQLQERDLRVEVRSHRGGFDFLAAFENHAPRATAANGHAVNRSAGADLHTFGASGRRDR